MRCPNCQRDNEATNRYCIYCGTSLVASGADEIQEGLQTAGEIKRLRELVAQINDRLDTLERTQGVTTPSEEKALTAELEQVAAVPALEVPQEEVVEAPAAEVKQRQPTAIVREWEQILGGNWLARIGVLSLVIGAGFFLKFAFDKNWLGPTGRVILGIVAGLGMLVGGHYWRKKYPTFAQAISGGGIALLYLSIFAAFAMFSLIDFYLAVALLFIISVVSAVLALRYNSMALAIIGIIGAFIAPFILAVSTATTTGTTQAIQSIWLLVYIMVVDIGVLWLSTFRNWRWFTLLALVGSLAVFGVWYDRFGSDFNLFTSQGSLTIIFLIFVGATMLYHILWRRIPQTFDYCLMVINATAYYGISYALLSSDLRAWLGGFSFLIALFYGGLAYLASKRGAVNTRLAFFALGIALLFFTVAIPVQLGDKAWTTIAWAAEGTILMWISFKLRMPYFRACSYMVFIATAARLMFFDSTISSRDFTPVINERFLAFIVSIAAIYLTGYLLRRNRDALTESEKEFGYSYHIFIVAANLFTIVLLSIETWSYFSREISIAASSEDTRHLISGLRSARNLSLTALWAVYAVILLVLGIIRRIRWLRLIGLGLLAISVVKVYVYDVFELEQVYRIVAFVGLGILLIVSGYLYQRYKEVIKDFIVEK